jgi:hypothetical protein
MTLPAKLQQMSGAPSSWPTPSASWGRYAIHFVPFEGQCQTPEQQARAINAAMES